MKKVFIVLFVFICITAALIASTSGKVPSFSEPKPITDSIEFTAATAATIGTATTLLATSGYVAIYNESATYTLFIGPSSVVATSGYPILPLGEFKARLEDNTSIYGCSTDDMPIRILRGN